MRSSDQGEGIGIFQQGFDLAGVVQDLDRWEVDADLAAVQLVAVVGGFPAFAVIGQHGQAGDRATIAVVEPVVVGEQALGEGGIVLALDEWAC